MSPPPIEPPDAATTHRFTARTAWAGSTGVGYDAYGRAHEASAPPAALQPTLSAAPAFHGDPQHLNPELLLLLAATSCQLLSFLAVAARARIDVVAYEDEAEAELPAQPRPRRITRITLRPRITIRADALPSHDRLRRLVELAHRECFIANSLAAQIDIEPTFVRQPPGG